MFMFAVACYKQEIKDLMAHLIGSDRSHDKKWEAVCVGGRGGRLRWEAESGRPRWEAESGRPKLGGRCVRPICEAEVLPDWLGLSDRSISANQGAPRPHTSASQFHLKINKFLTSTAI